MLLVCHATLLSDSYKPLPFLLHTEAHLTVGWCNLGNLLKVFEGHKMSVHGGTGVRDDLMVDADGILTLSGVVVIWMPFSFILRH